MSKQNVYPEFNPSSYETKWQKEWEKLGLFQNKTYLQEGVTPDNKKYLLFAFAYPSGTGLHVGHVIGKTALDILARYYRAKGQKVFFPVGWDAFGLPAENYAIKTGIPPAVTTKKAIDTFRQQVKRIGISYDWSTEISTSHPGYYKWTQWLFLKLYEKGLAYKKKAPVNWCPSCQTVLANEQVVNGTCERCDTEVIQKNMSQWFFKITKYVEELISGLDEIDWYDFAKQQQLNWIGKSEGVEISFPLHKKVGNVATLDVFTTRPDTLYGVTFMVVSPEHPLVKSVLKGSNIEPSVRKKVEEYVQKSLKKTEEERKIGKDKTGEFLGVYVKHPLTDEKIPVWVADYVLSTYGTGAIMAVPAHDERDFAFAKKYNLPIKYVVKPKKGKLDMTKPFTSYGVSFNSPLIDDLPTQQAFSVIAKHLEKSKIGQKKVTYKLRDWLVSRQRYWGAPIPIVYDPQGNPHPVKEEHLPWLLPEDVDFKPTGESPLKSSKEFKERTEKLYGKGWTPEYDTMDTFVDSSWYFMRYTDPRNEKEFANKKQLKKWLPVDLYIIGPEHIVLHLLYSRFFTKFVRDLGYLNINEPVKKIRHQGMILGPDHKKMSKSKGNVISPDVVVDEYGADTLRIYEMFMGPYESDKPWDTRSVQGVYRFLGKVWRLYHITDFKSSKESSKDIKLALSNVLHKVDTGIERLSFNTIVASMMEFVNVWNKESSRISKEDAFKFLKVLSFFAPFITEELYNKFFKEEKSIHTIPFTDYKTRENLVSDIVIPIQVNGKVRGSLNVSKSALESLSEEDIFKKALEVVQKYVGNKRVIKSVYVPERIISFAVEG